MDRKVSKDGRMKEASSRLVSAEQKSTLEMSLIWPERLVEVSKLSCGWVINFDRMEEAAPRLVSAEQKTQLEMLVSRKYIEIVITGQCHIDDLIADQCYIGDVIADQCYDGDIIAY